MSRCAGAITSCVRGCARSRTSVAGSAIAVWRFLLKREGKGMNPEEGVPTIPRGAADGAQAWRSQAGARHAGADGDPAGTQPTLVARLRVGLVACGRRFSMLNVIDDYSRECLVCIVDTSLSGRRVVRELSAIAARRGCRAWWSATMGPS